MDGYFKDPLSSLHEGRDGAGNLVNGEGVVFARLQVVINDGSKPLLGCVDGREKIELKTIHHSKFQIVHDVSFFNVVERCAIANRTGAIGRFDCLQVLSNGRSGGDDGA